MKQLHPFCRECGWRKGGIDSWDGRACKCGFYAEALPYSAEILNADFERGLEAEREMAKTRKPE